MEVYSKNSILKKFTLLNKGINSNKNRDRDNLSKMNNITTLKKISKSMNFSLPKLQSHLNSLSTTRNHSDEFLIPKDESSKRKNSSNDINNNRNINNYNKKINKNDNNSKNLISLKKLFKFKIIQSKKQKIKENKLLKMYNFDKKYLQWAEIFNKEKKNYSLIDNPNFSIIEYNNQLLKIAYQNFSHESFGPMRKNCYSMNKIINDNAPKCINKWTIFSNKIEFFAPQHLINKLNYFGSSKRIRNRNKLKNNSL